MLNNRELSVVLVVGILIIGVSSFFLGGGNRNSKDAEMNMERAEGFVEGGLHTKQVFEAELATDNPLAGLARVDNLEFQALREEVTAGSKRIEQLTEELEVTKRSLVQVETELDNLKDGLESVEWRLGRATDIPQDPFRTRPMITARLKCVLCPHPR